ncbi:MAG: hypothetical protein AB7I41_06255 [Candidatus Sericytochromatia bacterium]
MTFRHDLIVLVADGNMESAVRSLLKRHQALGIQSIDAEIIKAAGTNDPGCIHSCVGYLHGYLKTHKFALVMLDFEGSGQEHQIPAQIEANIQTQLIQDGWVFTGEDLLGSPRAEAVVIRPELENWVWTSSAQLPQVLGWPVGEDLRSWLESQQLWTQNQAKPSDPKKALEKTLRFLRKPRSSSIYKNIAETVSFKHCSDTAFQRFCAILRRWFL